MTRPISIVLIAAISLQTVGCSTWRPLVRANEVPEDDRQTYMREKVMGKLEQGMAVRITICEGTPAPFKGQAIECIIEEIGQDSLALIPITDHIRGTVKREFTLHFTDILHIENREFNRGLSYFTLGLAGGAMLYFILMAVALQGLD